jgi:hypothetical protein
MSLWNRVAWTNRTSSWAIAITVCCSSRVHSWRGGRWTSQFHILASSSTCRWGRSRHGSGEIISVCELQRYNKQCGSRIFKFVKRLPLHNGHHMKLYCHILLNGMHRHWVLFSYVCDKVLTLLNDRVSDVVSQFLLAHLTYKIQQ